MFRVKSLSCALALAFAGLVSPARAGGDGHDFHPNHAALFLGATLLEGSVYPTVGLDYERYLTPQVGLVGLAEIIVHDPLAQVVGAGVAYHPIAPVKIAALGGMEFSDGHSAFLVRGNLEYGIHVGALGIAPSVSVDYVDSHVVYVFGLAVGLGF